MLGDDDEMIGLMRAELQDLSNTIQRTMREVATIRHPMMENDRVQSAVDELGAIVAATEFATEQILSAAEAVEASLGSGAELSDTARASTVDAVTTIYEACNFQDLTGQRITRVMTLLREVDERLMAIIQHVGPERFIAEAPLPDKAPKQGDAALLNGPAPAGTGLQQDSIDSLFA